MTDRRTELVKTISRSACISLLTHDKNLPWLPLVPFSQLLRYFFPLTYRYVILFPSSVHDHVPVYSDVGLFVRQSAVTDRCRFTSSRPTLCFRLRDLFVVSSFTQKSFKNYNEKSAQRRRKHCALAVVRRSQNFSPRRRPPSRARDGQNLISWRWSLSLPTNPIWSMHAISSYRGNRPTHTHPPTHRQD